MSAFASRRAVLGGLAVVPLITAPALAAAPHPDAALLSLRAQWGVVSAAYEAALKAASELDGIGHPVAPDALFLREEDYDLRLHLLATKRGDGRVWYCVGAPGVYRTGDELRGRHSRVQTVPVRPGDKVHPGATHITKKLAWPERQARADEIVSAWDSWKAACGAADETSGYAMARAKADRIGIEHAAIERELEVALPRTLDGLVALATFARRYQAEQQDEECLGGMLARAILAVAGGAA